MKNLDGLALLVSYILGLHFGVYHWFPPERITAVKGISHSTTHVEYTGEATVLNL